MKFRGVLKRFFTAGLGIITTFIMCLLYIDLTYASQDTTTYKFAAIDLLVDVPNELICFTQTTTNNNSYLELIGASDAAEVQNSMISNNCYLEAVNSDMTYELAITGVKANSSLTDFDTLSDDDLCSTFDAYIESEKNIETEYKQEEILSSDIVYFNDLPYFMESFVSTSSEGVVVYGVKYYTVTNGYIYNFAIQTNTSSITDEMLDNMATVLNSAKFMTIKSSIFDNGVFSETMSVILTAAIPIIILAVIVYFIRIGNKKKQNKLIKEEMEIKKQRENK